YESASRKVSAIIRSFHRHTCVFALTGALDQTVRIEDQDGASITQLGGSGNGRDLQKWIVDRSNNDFALAEQAVRDNADRAQTRSDHKHWKLPPGLGSQTEEGGEAYERQNAV